MNLAEKDGMGLKKLLLGWAIVALLVAACQEELTAPADCPALCPGGYEIRDTVIDPIPDGDSSYEGYVLPGQGTTIRVSNGLPASEDRGVIRFNSRPDSLLLRDTLRTYTVDSATIEFTITRRDTTVTGLKMYLYRLPATIDTAATFGQVTADMIAANLLDSALVDDTADTPRIKMVFKDTTTYKLDIPAADSGVLAVGLAMVADAPSGVRIGTILTGSSAPVFSSFVTVNIADTTLQKRSILLNPQFSDFVSQNPPVLDPDQLTTGGAPSARSLIRFDWPDFIRDSGQLVRATLELVPTAPFNGLPNDPGFLEARIILSDLGAKSVLSQSTFAEFELPEASSDTVEFEVVGLLSAWQTIPDIPHGIALSLTPEGSSFTRATFGSTRTPGMAPRLKVTYAVPFRFARP
jgi:hypothetical protein